MVILFGISSTVVGSSVVYTFADDPELEFELFEVELILPPPCKTVVLVWIESPSKASRKDGGNLMFSSEDVVCQEHWTELATRRRSSDCSSRSISNPNFIWLTTYADKTFQASAAVGQTACRRGVEGPKQKGVGDGEADGVLNERSSPGNKNLLSYVFRGLWNGQPKNYIRSKRLASLPREDSTCKSLAALLIAKISPSQKLFNFCALVSSLSCDRCRAPSSYNIPITFSGSSNWRITVLRVSQNLWKSND